MLIYPAARSASSIHLGIFVIAHTIRSYMNTAMRLTALLFCLSLPLNALIIDINYRYDTNKFFSASGNPGGAEGAAEARAALEKAAARWSSIINETLDISIVRDHPSTDVRIAFPDPSKFTGGGPGNPLTYDKYEASGAASPATDSRRVPAQLSPVANEYRDGIVIPANTFIIYVGARFLTSDAFTGALIGNNYDSIIDGGNSILNRGFNSGSDSLPVWGSSISFNSAEDADNDPSGIKERKWHFDHTKRVPSDAKDFYSVALAEIGRALGVGLFYTDWTKNISASKFRGAFSRGKYAQENGATITGFDLDTKGRYFRRSTYFSKIFAGGNPNYVGTVGSGKFQNLLLEAPRTGPDPGEGLEGFVPGIKYGVRYEITNLDVAMIQDTGWSAISSAPSSDVGFITLTRSQFDGIVLTFPSEDGFAYTIQTSTNMQNWMNVTPNINSEGTSTDWTDGEAGYNDPYGPGFARRRKYYRVLKVE